MAADLGHIVIDVQWKNERALAALRVLLQTLQDVAEDFPYRDDVKNAVKAANYLAKNVTTSLVGDRNGN